ncbi:hypothetical protein V494_04779 [Pseudogymnoascus sp. VKM F-4513 (FW-928)]|nr:hypothetical protein V494_04779 [Pseudogymnoascus sp. VKM F-4513 (FW-928)]
MAPQLPRPLGGMFGTYRSLLPFLGRQEHRGVRIRQTLVAIRELETQRESIQRSNVAGKLKGWRTVMVLKKRMRGSHEEESLGTHSVEDKRVSPMDGCGGLRPLLTNYVNTDLMLNPSPIARAKPEGQKWQGGPGIKRDDADSRTLRFEVNGNIKSTTEVILRLKTERSEERRESLVQMRIRLLEQSQKNQQNLGPTIPKEKKVARLQGSNHGITNRPTDSKIVWAGHGREERDDARLQEPHPLLASNYSKSLDFPNSAIDGGTISATSPIVSLEIHAPSSAKQKLETAAESESEVKQESVEAPALKIQFRHLGAKNRKDVFPKSLAPIIRERVKMFESTRDGENVNLAPFNGPLALHRGRVNDSVDAKHGSGEEIFERVKEVVEENQVKVERPNPTANEANKTISVFSRCLAERRRSRTVCIVDGKYVSAFAHRRKPKEMSTSSSWASTTASGESEATSLDDTSIIPASSANFPNGRASGHISQPVSEQRSNSSLVPISSLLNSESRTNTVSDWSYDSHEASPLPPTAPSISPPLEDTRAQRRASVDTLLQAKNLRVSKIIAMANRHEHVATSRIVARNRIGRTNAGSTGVGAWKDSESSDDDDGTLIVQSVAKLREPKPLRVTEHTSEPTPSSTTIPSPALSSP